MLIIISQNKKNYLFLHKNYLSPSYNSFYHQINFLYYLEVKLNLYNFINVRKQIQIVYILNF